MFGAILRFGWENIKHYVLFDGLDKATAELIEASLIRGWHTYRPGAGYNEATPKPYGLESYNVPEFSRKRIFDEYDLSVTERLSKRKYKRDTGISKRCRQIRIVETGAVFNSVVDAAASFMVSPSSIQKAVGNKNRTCGSVWIEDTDEGWRMEVPAHWEYVNK